MQQQSSPSQHGPLFDATVVKAKKAGRVVEAVTISALLFGCGAFAGWWVRDTQAQTNRVAMRADHLAELQRLNENYTKALDYMSGKVNNAAITANQATDTALDAVQAADKAVGKAVVAADKATVAATKAAVAARKVETVPESTRLEVNRAVDRANNSVKK